jgi:hypothetical protein
MKKLLTILASALLYSGLCIGQATQSTSTTTTQNDTGIKQDTHEAGHDVVNGAKAAGRATKNGAKKVGHGTKKLVNKGAHQTKKGADKVEDKTTDNNPR